MNTSTTVSGYSISYRIVDEVDNQGRPCEHCQIVDSVITRCVYGVDMAGNRTTVECCEECTSGAIAEYLDRDHGVTIEVGSGVVAPKWMPPVVYPTLTDYLHGDDEADNGLMAHPDDMRLHPDAV